MQRKKDGLPLVCKEVNVRNVSKKEKDKIFEEVEVLRKLRHVNIVQLHEAFADNTSLNIIMECVQSPSKNILRHAFIYLLSLAAMPSS